MDTLDQTKNQSPSPGNEKQASNYVCQNCGWEFPKVRPSAKHRRAHKKICGTIEGYPASPQTTQFSDDDEYHSGRDRTPSSSKRMDGSRIEKSFSGVGAMSNRSEDDVYADAITEFTETRLTPALGIREGVVFPDKIIANAGLPIVMSSPLYNGKESCHDNYQEVPGADKTEGSIAETQDLAISSSKESDAMLRDDNENFGHDLLYPRRTETQIEPSLPNKNTKAGDDVTDREPQTHLNGNEGTKLGRHQKDAVASEVTAMSEKRDDMILNAETNDEIHESEPYKVFETAVDSLQTKTDTAEEILSTDPMISSEDGDGNEGNDEFFLLVPDHIPAVDDAGNKLEDFKDHIVVQPNQSAFLDSSARIISKESGTKSPVCGENSTSPSGKPSLGNEVSTLDIHSHGRLVVEDVSAEGKAGLPEMNFTSKETSNDTGTLYDASAIHMTEEDANSLSGEHHSHDVVKPLLQVDFAVPSMSPMIAHSGTEVDFKINLDSIDDPDSCVEKRLYLHDIAENNTNKTNKNESSTKKLEGDENRRLRSYNLLESEVNLVSNVLEGGDKNEGEEGAKLNWEVARMQNRKPFVDNTPIKIESTPESAISLPESSKVTNAAFNIPDEKSLATEKVSDFPKAVREDTRQAEHILVVGLDFTTENSIPKSATTKEDQTEEILRVSHQGENNNNSYEHQLGTTSKNVSVDSCSQTNSVEASWESFSEAGNSKRPQIVSGGQCPVVSGPTLRTLVEPLGEIQIEENKQTDETGWFPSLAHQTVKDSEGRKKIEEIINNAANWSPVKQSLPLKSLLVEAKSPKQKENQSVGAKSLQEGLDEESEREISESLISRADRKRDKKAKVKGRPSWAPFLCCS